MCDLLAEHGMWVRAAAEERIAQIVEPATDPRRNAARSDCNLLRPHAEQRLSAHVPQHFCEPCTHLWRRMAERDHRAAIVDERLIIRIELL